MKKSRLIDISHFSDVLCIWAYLAQIRVDELKSEFGSHVNLQYHFFPVFGSVETMMENNWSNLGGLQAYNSHVLKIASSFEHINVHNDIWLKNRPATSISCHLFLKAIQILEEMGELPVNNQGEDSANTVFENMVWELRLAFFRDLKDISNFNVQIELAEKLGLPVDGIRKNIESGEAYAAMDIDSQLKEKYRVAGSPTFVFNEGRQIIYGNVGYRVIEANVKELISQPESQASWC